MNRHRQRRRPPEPRREPRVPEPDFGDPTVTVTWEAARRSIEFERQMAEARRGRKP